jgi:hypothetical protein
MPIFARRRLNAMLHDLAPHLTVPQATDLRSRLDHCDTQPALAAEFELAVLWGIARVANLEIGPEFQDGASRPDALSADLFGSRRAVIEITALSDDTFSGQVYMDRAANILAQAADRIRKGASAHLYFMFQETSDYQGGRYRRIRRVTSGFRPTSSLEGQLRTWLQAPDWLSPGGIRLTDDQIDVVVSWKEFVHPLFRAFSSMPAVAYDLKDNHIFKALRKKEKQVASAPADMLKCIFLCDAGCRILRELRPMGVAETNGDQIIRHFLKNSSIDVVCVLSPQKTIGAFYPAFSSSSWTMNVYDRRQSQPESEYARLRRFSETLPRPNYEGYQARTLHRQGEFLPQARGQYLGMRIESRISSMTIKISSRLVQEFLAGRISHEQFKFFAFGKDTNLFEHQLVRGFTIQNARVEKAGIDEDDDYIVFDLEPDASALPLVNPKSVA